MILIYISLEKETCRYGRVKSLPGMDLITMGKKKKEGGGGRRGERKAGGKGEKEEV